MAAKKHHIVLEVVVIVDADNYSLEDNSDYVTEDVADCLKQHYHEEDVTVELSSATEEVNYPQKQWK